MNKFQKLVHYSALAIWFAFVRSTSEVCFIFYPSYLLLYHKCALTEFGSTNQNLAHPRERCRKIQGWNPRCVGDVWELQVEIDVMDPDEDPLTAALRTARYNEIVHVIVESPRDTPEEGVGQSDCSNPDEARSIEAHPSVAYCLSPAVASTGIQFNAIPDDQIVSRDLQTKRWFFPMLNDSRRNQVFHDAIEQCMREVPEKTTVLDIGSGTGLLAMMSASHERCSSVTSVEMSASMSAIAQQTIQDNGKVCNSIRLVTNHSTAVDLSESPTEERYGVCTSELLDDGLLGEGWIPAMRDAWERLLTPECHVLPQRARIWAQLAETTLSLAPVDGSRPPGPRFCPIQATRLLRERTIQPRSDPFVLFEFDVTSKDTIPPPVGRERTITVTTKYSNEEDSSSTTIDAVLVWWDIEVYKGLSYSTDPSSAPFQDHWHPCLHWCSTSSNVSCGDEVTLQAEHDDYRLKIDLVLAPEHARKRSKTTSTGSLATPSHSSWGVERMLQLGDGGRGEKMRRALGRILSTCKRGSSAFAILDLSDFCWAGSIAASCFPKSAGPCTIISLESSSGNLPEQTAEWIRNNQEPSASSTQWEIRRGYAEELNAENTPCVAMVVAEPYYEVLEGWHLQEALNLYAILSVLRQNKVVTASTRIVPRLCRVKGCLVESNDLRSAYTRCGDDNGRIQDFIIPASIDWLGHILLPCRSPCGNTNTRSSARRST